MTPPIPVYIVSVQAQDDGLVVTVSGKGGRSEQWLLSLQQARMVAVSLGAALSQVSPAELASELAALCEVPFSG